MDTDPLPGAPLAQSLLLSTQRAVEFMAPTDWVGWAFIVAIAVACLVMSGFVSGSEIAYFGLTESDVEHLQQDQEHPRARQAYALISESERLLATILICNTLVNITMVITLSFAIDRVVVFNSQVIGFLVQTVFLTFLLLLFGEIFPKLVARGRKMSWVMKVSPVLTVLSKVVWPLAAVMVRSTSMLNRIVSKRPENISTDELEKALEISDIKEGEDKEMLEGILTFGEKDAAGIMTSRVDMTAIDITDSWEETIETVLKSGYSRIPVYEGTVDNIKGVLYSKDMLPYISHRVEGFHWPALIREAYFVPESRMIDDLLEDFRKKKIHIAIVIDEYGGTQGLVTLEDVIEEIVGDIDDEYDEEEKLYKKIGQDTYVFEAKVPIADFCRITGVDEDEFRDIDDVETIAGLLLAVKGDFPKEKEPIVVGRCRFLVLDIEKHRITSVRVKVMPESAA